MLESILPRSLDEGYRGHPVARVVLVILFGITLARSLVHIFFSDGGAQSIATIPLVGAAMLYLSLRRQPGKDSSDGIASKVDA